MKLIFVYSRQDRTTSPEHFAADGLCPMLAAMVERRMIDRALVVVDGGPYFTKALAPGVDWYTVPELGWVLEMLEPGDVVWIRGGFKPTDVYQEIRDRGHWLLFYGANTGRERWPFWHVVFDDLGGESRFDENGRLYWEYFKPVHPDIFEPQNLNQVYDVCIGASYITDKKGQWLGIKAAAEYAKLTGRKLKCIMPGAMRHGSRTNAILDDIQEAGLEVEQPGMVSRLSMSEIYNLSKIFLHFGGGQNDRSLLEAMRCGCTCLVLHPQYHAPFTTLAAPEVFYLKSRPKPGMAAEFIDYILGSDYPERRRAAHNYFERNSGMEVVLGRMEKLFGFLRECPKAYVSALKEWGRQHVQPE